MWNSLSRVVYAVTLVSVPSVAYTNVIGFEFTGSVTFISDTSGLLGTSFAIGDPVNGTFHYDLSAQDRNPGAEFGRFIFTSPPSGISFTVNGFTFRSDPTDLLLDVTVRDRINEPADNLLVISRGGRNKVPPQFALTDSAIDFQLADNTGTVLQDDALLSDIRLNDWTWAAAEVIASDVHDRTRGYRILSESIHSVTLIPEPSALLLLAIGLAGIAGVRPGF